VVSLFYSGFSVFAGIGFKLHICHLVIPPVVLSAAKLPMYCADHELVEMLQPMETSSGTALRIILPELPGAALNAALSDRCTLVPSPQKDR
jgi:hypothetical protein